MGRVWCILRWPLGALLLLYVAVVVYRIPAAGEKQKTAQTVAFIRAQKITLDDVLGKHLPDAPDQALNDATRAGNDANQNGIRDDVERAIFARYPGDARTRGGELQYAFALQMEFTRVFNQETLVAVIQQEDRGYECAPTPPARDEVEQLVFNTPARKQWREDIRQKYMTSFSLQNVEPCDVAPASLPQ